MLLGNFMSDGNSNQSISRCESQYTMSKLFLGFSIRACMVVSSSPFLFYGSIPMRFRFHSFSKLKLTIEKTTPSSNVLRIGSTYKFVFQLATDFQSIFDGRNISFVKNFKSYLYVVINLKRILRIFQTILWSSSQQ